MTAKQSHLIRKEESAIPCPFCGGRDIHRHDNGRYLVCWSCWAIGPIGDDPLKAWNKRAEPGLETLENQQIAIEGMMHVVQILSRRVSTIEEWMEKSRKEGG